ncbi:thermonuclease family protein [Pseudomonas sp. M30-35]|uniref:thermonuclease family protein n=1 Tax=Pseudomonas sp. M30-35 TaxID=1981174 RepID=UPI000B3D0743|nr:thermonuclease family protein [Pseudomonas sp. M30-35]ARU90112.1 nuclease [Pseudomonas sp. M30-35]
MVLFSKLKKASLVGAFFVFAIYLSPALALCPTAGEAPVVSVSRVVDGDTLRLADGRSVRLIGINTPEMAGKGRTVEPYAEQAKRRLSALVAASDGRIALQVGVEPKDRYGRTLAHVYDTQGRSLEAQLLAEGLGYWVAVAPNLEQRQCLQVAEQTARVAKLGIWRNPPFITPEALNAGGFALVRGTVRRVQRNRGGIWLEMGGSLVLRVPVDQADAFSKAQGQDLVGRAVEARGWVVDRARRSTSSNKYARWMLTLGHESMLQVLP